MDADDLTIGAQDGLGPGGQPVHASVREDDPELVLPGVESRHLGKEGGAHADGVGGVQAIEELIEIGVELAGLAAQEPVQLVGPNAPPRRQSSDQLPIWASRWASASRSPISRSAASDRWLAETSRAMVETPTILPPSTSGAIWSDTSTCEPSFLTLRVGTCVRCSPAMIRRRMPSISPRRLRGSRRRHREIRGRGALRRCCRPEAHLASIGAPVSASNHRRNVASTTGARRRRRGVRRDPCSWPTVPAPACRLHSDLLGRHQRVTRATFDRRAIQPGVSRFVVLLLSLPDSRREVTGSDDGPD